MASRNPTKSKPSTSKQAAGITGNAVKLGRHSGRQIAGIQNTWKFEEPAILGFWVRAICLPERRFLFNPKFLPKTGQNLG
ncbi:MAG: hypothetical protein ACRERU_17005 [Methylococcales bacterium]